MTPYYLVTRPRTMSDTRAATHLKAWGRSHDLSVVTQIRLVQAAQNGYACIKHDTDIDVTELRQCGFEVHIINRVFDHDMVLILRSDYLVPDEFIDHFNTVWNTHCLPPLVSVTTDHLANTCWLMVPSGTEWNDAFAGCVILPTSVDEEPRGLFSLGTDKNVVTDSQHVVIQTAATVFDEMIDHIVAKCDTEGSIKLLRLMQALRKKDTSDGE